MRASRFKIELRAGGDAVVHHQEVQAFLTFLVVDGADDHAAGVDAHHGARRQVGDGDERLAHQRFRLVVLVDAAEDDAVRARAVVEDELEQLFWTWAPPYIPSPSRRGSRTWRRSQNPHRSLNSGSISTWISRSSPPWADNGRFRLRGLGLGRVLLFQRLHRREEQHVADGGRIGEQHHESGRGRSRGRPWEAGRIPARGRCPRPQRRWRPARAWRRPAFQSASRWSMGSFSSEKAVAELAGGDEVLKALGKQRVVRLALGPAARPQWGNRR